LDDIIKIAMVPVLMLLGIALKQAKIGLKASHLELLIIYFTLPILMFTEMLTMRLDELSLGGIAGLSLVYLAFCFLVSYLSCRRLSSKEKGTVVFNATFFNSMFLPFPLIYAFYGDLSVAIIFSLPIAILHNTIGVFLASYWGHGKIERGTLVRAVTFPPLLGFFVGALTRPMLTGFISSPAFDTLNVLGLSSVYLSLILVGLTIPISKDSLLVFRNSIAGRITVNRMLISPILALILVVVLNPVGIVKSTIIIMSFMPPAFTNLVITSRFGLDVEATCQSIFLPSLLSVGVVFALRFFALI
jgi:predicted permease